MEVIYWEVLRQGRETTAEEMGIENENAAQQDDKGPELLQQELVSALNQLKKANRQELMEYQASCWKSVLRKQQKK